MKDKTESYSIPFYRLDLDEIGERVCMWLPLTHSSRDEMIRVFPYTAKDIPDDNLEFKVERFSDYSPLRASMFYIPHENFGRSEVLHQIKAKLSMAISYGEVGYFKVVDDLDYVYNMPRPTVTWKRIGTINKNKFRAEFAKEEGRTYQGLSNMVVRLMDTEKEYHD